MTLPEGTEDENCVQKVKSTRRVDPAQGTEFSVVNERLKAGAKYLREKLQGSAVTTRPTHKVHENYRDWWRDNKRCLGNLLIADDERELRKFYTHIATCYELQVPQLLYEVKTPHFTLYQDVIIKADPRREFTAAELVQAEELVKPGSAFMRLLGQAICERYVMPQGEEHGLVAVYHASGYDLSDDWQKTVIRFVWRDIVVDKGTAACDYLVKKFTTSQDPAIKTLEEKLKGLCKGTPWTWNSVFCGFVHAPSKDVQMPLCDKCVSASLQKPANLVLRPLGVFQCRAEGWIEEESEDVEGCQWVELGCVRKPLGSKLTPCVEARGAAPGAARRPVRTDHGSGSYGCRPKRGGAPAQAQEPPVLRTETRSFAGSIEDFQELLVATELNRLGRVTQEGQDVLVFKIDGGATLSFQSRQAEYTVSGTAAQTRAMLERLERCAGQRTVAPSEVYNPQAADLSPAAAPQEEPVPEEEEDQAVGPRRVCIKEFRGEQANEMELMSVGDEVSVEHDPEAEGGACRWVWGINITTDKTGWFPYNYTSDLPQDSA